MISACLFSPIRQMVAKDVLEEFAWRGLLSQSTDRKSLKQHLSAGSEAVYCGFDPTADSLHIGSLVPLLALRRFQILKHRPIVLIGGATGLIGDPSGRDSERPLVSKETILHRTESLKAQVSSFLDLQGEFAGEVVNNLSWTEDLDVISFLRDIGKHFSVNAMIQRDSIRTRIEREGEGISYTEFSYMLLQSLDFLELAKTRSCSLQIGGNDQWGNIVSGVDLVRRNLGIEAHALTLPLVTKADGTKFGKTSSGAVWLDKAKTSPYSFHQYWLNIADEDVTKFLKFFTFLTEEEILESAKMVESKPQERFAQRLLADNVTDIVHGKKLRVSAQTVASVLFKGDVRDLDETDIQQLELDGLEVVKVAPGDGLLTVMSDSEMAKSRGQARSLVKSGGVSLNGRVVSNDKYCLEVKDALFGRYFFLRRGKKLYKLLVINKR